MQYVRDPDTGRQHGPWRWRRSRTRALGGIGEVVRDGSMTQVWKEYEGSKLVLATTTVP